MIGQLSRAFTPNPRNGQGLIWDSNFGPQKRSDRPPIAEDTPRPLLAGSRSVRHLASTASQNERTLAWGPQPSRLLASTFRCQDPP